MSPRYDYNPLGPEGFRDLCHAVLRRALGADYRPYVAGGGDGGRDATFEGVPRHFPDRPGYWVFQFKHHDVASIGVGTARSRLLTDLRSELETWAESTTRRKPDYLVFVTNVAASGVPDRGTWDRFDQLRTHYASAAGDIRLWDQGWLDTELGVHADVRRRFFNPAADAIADLFGIPPQTVLAAFGATLSQQAPESEGPMAHEANRVEEIVEAEFNALYSEDKRAIILLGDIGNLTPRRLTLRQLRVDVSGAGNFQPDEHHGGLSVSGYDWADARPLPLDAEQFCQRAWYINAPELLDLCRQEQPLRARVDCRFFPEYKISRDIDLFTIAELKRRSAADL